jgi:7-cyano-7-deazaguanine synthase in queuosine biosynthesis
MVAAMATLVMLSGGLDSAAALYKLLTETRDELHVHHVRLVNRDRRERAEQDAVEAIVAWCRAHCRPFRYSESVLDFAELEAIPIDYLAIAFAACQVAIDTPGCNRIAVGTLAADLDEIKRRVSEAQRRVFDAMYACYRARKLGDPDLKWIYPVYQLTKAQVAASLPEELRACAWSCRRPVATADGYRICGECKPCRKRAEVAAELRIAL